MSEQTTAKTASWWPAVARGLRGLCPVCGEAPLFSGYIRMGAACGRCRAALEPHRADDVPAYLTIFVVGHLIVPLVLMLERAAAPATWVQISLWLPLTAGLALALLPRIKGAVIGLQWALDVRREL